MAKDGIRLEETIDKIGGCGRYQISLALVIHSMKCIVCFTMVFMVFGGAVPDWWCADDEFTKNATEVSYTRNSALYKSCKPTNSTKTCTKFVFDQTRMRTVVAEWDLVCDRAWIRTTITTVQMIGVLIGNVACGQVADHVGRKPPLYLSIFTLVIFNVVGVFSVSWVMFVVIRFILGVAMGFELTVHYNVMSEFTVARWRAWVVAVPSFAIELALFGLVAWLLHDWQHLHIAAAAVGAPLLLTFWFVPESFRWYVSHDRFKEAQDVVNRIARINGRPTLQASELKQLTDTEKTDITSSTRDRKYSLIDLVRNRSLLKSTLLLSVVWITLGLGGYGIQFGVPDLSGDLYINIFVLATIGSPLQFINIYLQNRFGRKKTAILFYAIFCITAFIVGITQRLEESPTRNTIVTVAAIISLISINAGWSPIQTLTIEIYPTVVRNIGYGLQNTMARVGAAIGPQLIYLDSKVAGMMYFACGATAALSILMILPLRETKDEDLFDVIPDDSSNEMESGYHVVNTAEKEAKESSGVHNQKENF